MNPTFDLVYQPWIPCVDQGGQCVDLGLLDTLLYAHELREIADGSPLVSAALYRLTLAVLHRMFGPRNQREWADLWQYGQWPVEDLKAYFARWQDRFDLFHPQRPFYQALDNRVGPRPVFNLVHSIENNPTLFSHITKDTGVALTPAEAARALIAAQAYHSSGTRDPSQRLMFSDSPCTRGVVFIAQGTSLFQTLALNLIRYPSQDVWYTDEEDEDLPVWEMDDPFVKRTIPFGYLDYLTWQSLRVRLIPDQLEGQLVVREIIDLPGLRFDSNEGSLRDPMMLFQVVGKKEWLRSLQFSEGRALWRDMNTLFALYSDGIYPPYSFRWISELIQSGYLDAHRQYRFMALGMAGHQAKVFFYRHEHFPVQPEYLSNPDLVAALDIALGLAEEVAKKLRGAVLKLSELIIAPSANLEGGHKPDQSDTRNLADHLDISDRYWGSLEPFFWEFVETLPRQPEAAQSRWNAALRTAAWDAFSAAEELSGTAPNAMKAAVQARGQLGGGLRKVLPQEGGNDSGE